jgi:hypothetical protein
VDDVFSYVKDRYFLDESVVLISQLNNPKIDASKTKIVDIILPSDKSDKSGPSTETSSPTKSIPNGTKDHEKDEVVDVEMECEPVVVQAPTPKKSASSSSATLDPAKIKYVVETYATNTPQSNRQTVKANQIQRPKNLLTKDKVSMIVKTNCETNAKQVWCLTREAEERHKVASIRFSDIFRGEPPTFECTFGRGQFAKNPKTSPKQSMLSFDKSNGKLVNVNSDSSVSPQKSRKSLSNQLNSSASNASNKKQQAKKGAKSTQQVCHYFYHFLFFWAADII